MCLGVPGQVVEIPDDSPAKMGLVDFVGVRRAVCFAAVPDVQEGDYVLVHVGFALTKLDETTAHQTLDLFRGLGVLEDEFGAETAALVNGAITD